MRLIDPFTLFLIGDIILATFFPAHGGLSRFLDIAGSVGVAILFFSHGASLSRESVIGGAKQWQLHLLILLTTFVFFPLIILPLHLLPETWLPHNLYLGFLYLAALPSAVTSSIVFTSIARGNVPAAVCSAAASNVFGMMLTPFIAAFLMHQSGGNLSVGSALRDILLKLLLPFIAGQLIHPWVNHFMARIKRFTSWYDKGVIMLIVYTAFAQAVSAGLWHRLPPFSLGILLALCVALLFLMLFLTAQVSRLLGFPLADRIVAVFCGSKKSLASGLPMAKVLFAGMPAFGMLVLPIMFYNQLQIFVCSFLAQYYARNNPG